MKWWERFRAFPCVPPTYTGGNQNRNSSLQVRRIEQNNWDAKSHLPPWHMCIVYLPIMRSKVQPHHVGRPVAGGTVLVIDASAPPPVLLVVLMGKIQLATIEPGRFPVPDERIDRIAATGSHARWWRCKGAEIETKRRERWEEMNQTMKNQASSAAAPHIAPSICRAVRGSPSHTHRTSRWRTARAEKSINGSIWSRGVCVWRSTVAQCNTSSNR